MDYLVEAHFSLTEKAGPDDNLTKFTEIFQRRVEKGQHFHHPYFGCRECVAEVLPPDHTPAPIPETSDLGLMLWDIVYGEDRNIPVFFAAKLKNGVLEVPEDPGATWKGGTA